MNALVLGSADCLREDLEGFFAFRPHRKDWLVIAVNESGIVYPRTIDHWVTLHPQKLKIWERRRQGPSGYLTWGTDQWRHLVDRVATVWAIGSSGLFGVKISLEDLGCERVVGAGMPMDGRPHIRRGPWTEFEVHRRGWLEMLHRLEGRARFMSGWTRELLGGPTVEWLHGEEGEDEHPRT